MMSLVAGTLLSRDERSRANRNMILGGSLSADIVAVAGGLACAAGWASELGVIAVDMGGRSSSNIPYTCSGRGPTRC